MGTPPKEGKSKVTAYLEKNSRKIIKIKNKYITQFLKKELL